MCRRPGLVGLNLRTGMTRSGLLRRSRSCRRRAAARRPSSSRGGCRGSAPRRFGFGCTLITLTRSTLTEKSSSTAWRICVLCASDAPGTCSSRVSSRRSVFSLTIGARMTWLACTGSPPLDERQRALRHEERPRPHDGARPRARPARRSATRSRLRKLFQSVSSSAQGDDDERCRTPQASTSARAAFVDGASNCVGVDDGERSLLHVRCECRAQRRAERLAVHLLVERARATSRMRGRRPRTAARGPCPGARGRCPSGATASRGRRRRARGSSSRTCRRG